MDQLSFASLDYAAKKKRTKRDVFLAEMVAVVPWVALEAVIEPHYPKAGPRTSINDENPAPSSTHCEKVTLLRGSLAFARGLGRPTCKIL